MVGLYKYLRPERTDVLEKLQIRFSPAVSMNDAFELRPLTKGWAAWEKATDLLKERFTDFFLKADSPEKMLQVAIANHPEAEPQFRRTMKIIGPEAWFRLMREYVQLNLEQAAREAHETIEENWDVFAAKILAVLGTQIGILSLSEDPRNPVMWGNYADSSRGFVVGFDERHPWFHQRRSENDDFCELRKVTYVSTNSPTYFSELTAQDLGYSKLDSWSYEREWRILFSLAMGTKTSILDSFGQPVIVFPLPAACVTEVIVGSRATDDLFQTISRICQGLPNAVSVSKGAW
jgi:Protein of unknown function (DUF2971)